MLHFVITLNNSVAKLDDMFCPICFLRRLINKSEEVIDELFIYMNKGTMTNAIMVINVVSSSLNYMTMISLFCGCV